MLKAGTLGHEDGAFTSRISVLIRGYQTASYAFSHHARIQGQGAVCSPEEGSHQKWAMPKPCVSRSLHNCKFLLTWSCHVSYLVMQPEQMNTAPPLHSAHTRFTHSTQKHVLSARRLSHLPTQPAPTLCSLLQQTQRSTVSTVCSPPRFTFSPTISHQVLGLTLLIAHSCLTSSHPCSCLLSVLPARNLVWLITVPRVVPHSGYSTYWMNEWVSEWMREWGSDWMSE